MNGQKGVFLCILGVGAMVLLVGGLVLCLFPPRDFMNMGGLLTGVGGLLAFMISFLFCKATRQKIRHMEEENRHLEGASHFLRRCEDRLHTLINQAPKAAPAETPLRRREDRFKTLINSNADAIVVTVDDVICFANPAAEELFGRPVRDLMGNTIGFPVIVKDTQDIEILHPSGNCIVAAMRAESIEWEEKPAQLISLHNITERKSVEAKILHLNKVIRAIRNVNKLITKEKNRGRLVRGICESMVSTQGFKHAWIALTDSSGVYTHCGDAGIGEPFLEFKKRLENGFLPRCMQNPMTQSGVSITEAVVADCSDCPLRSAHQDQVLFSTRLENGQRVYGVLTASVERLFARDREEQSLFQEIGEDVSFALHHLQMEEIQQQTSDERKKLEQRLIQAQKMESIGLLAGGIAHDFNNILSAILGFTELAMDGVEKGSTLEDDLQEIYAGGKRAKDLVRQILSFARQTDENLTPIQIDVIAKEVLKFIRSSIPTTIEITSAIESDAMILGNATQMHQVFMNLFTNAAHAMLHGGGVLDVTLRDVEIHDPDEIKDIALVPGKYIEIKVSDTGVGISPDIMDKIFDPYFTTKPIEEGTGMGLAVIHGIIEGYGGKIKVDSTLGKGSLFFVYIPITREPEVDHHYEPEALPQGTERILFVDDEATIVKIGLIMLEKLGYKVTTCTSSVDALAMFRLHPDDFDLVITDMTMPAMTGDQLAAELIKIRPTIPVILCTGYSRGTSDEKLAAMGIRAFAEKPLDRADLARTVRRVLDGDNL